MRGIKQFLPVGVLTASLILSACSSSSSTDDSAPADNKPVPGGSLVDLQNFAAGDPDHIDPALASDVPSSQIAELLYDGLTETSADGQIRPAVAETVSPTDNGTKWTFKLRPDVRFDNNDVVEPSDFKFAWERAADPKLQSEISYHMASIVGYDEMQKGTAASMSGVVADDTARTLTVTLTEPRQDFNAVVSLPVFSPLPKEVFDAAGPNNTGAIYSKWEDSAMVGNGPFRMSKPWERGRGITLARSDTYYGGAANHKAYLDTLEFRVSKGLDAAYTDFEGGSGGMVGRIPSGRFADVKTQRGDNVVNTPLLGTEFWAFNMKSPSVGGSENVKLRQAMALAMNKADLVDKVFGGSRTVATSFTPQAMPGYDAALAQPERNVEQARTLMREYGKTPPALKISFPAGAGHEEKASILSQNLAEIGITATPDPLERAAYSGAIRSGSFDVLWRNWTADYVSYDNFIGPNFSTSSRDNVTNYSNPSFDALVKSARSESDASIRNRLYRDAEKMVLNDQVVIPLDWTSAGLVKSNQVHDLTVKPLGYVAYADAWMSR